jgi:hypothetical protein
MLSVLLIAVIGSGLPFPLFVPLRELLEPSVPPLAAIVKPYIASLVVLGSRAAVLATSAVASVLDWPSAEPPMVDPWLLGAQRIGAFTGMIMAAVCPTWLLVGWARRRVLLNPRPAPLRHVPLALAIAWTMTVSRPLVSLVGSMVFPVDTWLMLPSVAAAEGAEQPKAEWCAFQLHPSALDCEAQRVASTARKDENVHGFGFAGAVCVSAADVPHPECGKPDESGS